MEEIFSWKLIFPSWGKEQHRKEKSENAKSVGLVLLYVNIKEK